MSDGGEPVSIAVDGDFIVVENAALRQNRDARMFFDAILGAESTTTGWRCRVRRTPVADLVVRMNTFLERRGWAVDRQGVAQAAVERELERVRSFDRTVDAARTLRDTGTSPISRDDAIALLNEFGWDSSKRPLLAHQEAGLLHALTGINVANFSVPGSGKTATSLAIGGVHLASKTIDNVLVIGPLSSFTPWEREARAAFGDKLRARRVRGSARQRRDAYEYVDENELIIISYATAAADRLALINLCKRKKVMLIVDESHRIKRFSGGLWAPAISDIAGHARIRLILSGTPMPQSGKDLYSQLNVLWPRGELTGPRERFARRVQDRFDDVIREITPFVSRTPKEALGLPPYIVNEHEIELHDTQAEIYDLIEQNFRRQLHDAISYQDKIAALRRGRPIRLLQAASNPDLLNRFDRLYGVPPVETGSPTLMQRLSSYAENEVPDKFRWALDLLPTALGVR